MGVVKHAEVIPLTRDLIRETKMFGIFGGERGKVRKLRLHFEDIRQRVLYKMNGFEQYSFASAYVSLFDELEEHIASQGSAPNHKQMFAADLSLQAEEAWRMGRAGGDIHRESAQAGANALALHAIQIEAETYSAAEALTLATDIAGFRKRIEKYLAEHKNLYDMIPKD